MSHNNNHDEDSKFLNYEFSLTPYEDLYRPIPPSFPGSGSQIPAGGGFGPGGAYIPPPGSGGGFNPSGLKPPPFDGPPSGPPPSYIPTKKEKGVQSLNSSFGQPSAKAVSPNSINFCLYQYTYIWETNGRSYWAFLLFVDKVSVSGFRWMGRFWTYFGVDLRRIDSFVCYRDVVDNYSNQSPFARNEDTTYESVKLEYSLDEIREVYSKTLVSLDIPEVKEDFITETIGMVDDNKVKSKIPCIKTRTTTYRTIIEVSYPDSLEESLKEQINSIVDEVSQEVYNALFTIRSKDKYFNPLEIYNNSIKLISEALNIFSNLFSQKLQKLPNWKELSKKITYIIRREKNNSKWTPK